MSERSFTASLMWDKFGIGISGICTIHCLLFPAFVAVLPIWPVVTSVYEWLHPLFIFLLIPTVYFAVRRSHFDRKVTSILITGLLLITAGWLIGHLWLGVWVEVALTLSGSIVLISGHWMNYHHHRHCTNRHHKHHPIAEEIQSEVTEQES